MRFLSFLQPDFLPGFAVDRLLAPNTETLISGHLGGCFVTTSFEKTASEPIGRTMTI
jgi:hypothetical protein